MTTTDAAPSARPGEAVSRPARDDGLAPVMDLTAVSLSDVAAAGGKGANLGELIRAGFPVPRGFVVTSRAYIDAVEASGARDRLAAIFAGVDAGDSSALARCAADARAEIARTPIPDAVRDAVVAAYRAMGPEANVAVRSSGVMEDSSDASFAGMNSSFTNVHDERELLARIRDCWASLYRERAVAYRAGSASPEAEPRIAVIVQEMIPAQRSGVMFTVDPVRQDAERMVIEAVRGQGEAIVSGMVEPDTYVVARPGCEVISARTGSQDRQIIRGADGSDSNVALPTDGARPRVLDDSAVRALASIGLEVEAHYGTPQDIEWALVGETIHLVQSRPITTLRKPPDPPATPLAVLHGIGASAGRATGPVRVLRSPSDAAQLKDGEVLVAPMTSPDWVPALRRAAALVTDGGGLTSHASIVSRELGLPCVVGTRTATSQLRDGDIVTVDGRLGEVTPGPDAAGPSTIVGPGAVAGPAAGPVIGSAAVPRTATRLYLNIASPEEAEAAAALDSDGVGLLRAELLVPDALGGVHPAALIERGQSDVVVERMTASLRRIARAFAPRPVVYRSIDFRSNEFSGLQDGARFEPTEANPMIGYRGAFRYTDRPELFRLELDALGAVAAETGNLRLMIPFVRTAWELERCLAIIRDHPTAKDIPIWVMAEVPSVAYWIPTYADLGVTGVSIGSNDLTQLMLGVDRDSAQCAALFDESDPAVMDAIARIGEACVKAGITWSLCGSAPSRRPEYTAALVRMGITSISVEPRSFEAARSAVARAEWGLVVDAARGRAADAVRSLDRGQVRVAAARR